MAELWDIAQYVEDHPDDKKQRWRLAKKLYAACEYRLALEHLQILRNEMATKLTLRRYLAATYYRLGRYEEAARELYDAAEQWPDEAALLEQLTKVLEAAGKNQEAAGIWEEIANRNPEHPTAKEAAIRLRNPDADEAHAELHLHKSDSGFDLSTGLDCPHCGAQNSDEFERCWQCNGPLHAPGQERVAPHMTLDDSEDDVAPQTWKALGIATFIVLLIPAVYISVQAYLQRNSVPESLSAVLSQELLYTRLIIGGALLITWPLALFISLALVRARRVEGRPVTHLGLLLALATYLALWAPPHRFLYFFPIPITLAFALIAGRFRPGLGKTVVSWLLSASIVLIVTVSLFLGLETTRPAREAGAIIRFIRQQETTSKATDAAFLALPLSARLQLQWESSGSPWLDSRIAQVQFAVKANKPNVPLTVELARPQQMIFYKKTRGQLILRQAVSPTHPHELLIASPEGGTVDVTVRGILPITAEVVPTQAN